MSGNWEAKAVQLMADIPEVKAELYAAVTAHQQYMNVQQITSGEDPTWTNLLRTLTRFVVINLEIGQVYFEALKEARER